MLIKNIKIIRISQKHFLLTKLYYYQTLEKITALLQIPLYNIGDQQSTCTKRFNRRSYKCCSIVCIHGAAWDHLRPLSGKIYRGPG